MIIFLARKQLENARSLSTEIVTPLSWICYRVQPTQLGGVQMRTRSISVMCIALVLAFASIASAQARVQAGSDEDKALRKITAQTNPDAQIPMLLDFEKQYPKSQALSEVYAMLVD